MKTRHIALLGFTASSFLAMSLAGCSAEPAAAKPKKTTDGGTTTSGAGGSSGVTSGAAGSGQMTTTGGAGVMNMTPTTGAGGAPADCTPPDVTTKAQIAIDPAVLADFE